MNPLNLDEVNEFVNENIVYFHQNKLKSLNELSLNKLLTKNPYLFRAKNITQAGELIEGLLDAFLSSSEEKLFGDFLEELALFVAGKTTGGHKSSSEGVDLEFIDQGKQYIVSIKSGPNWGNSSQQKKLEQDLRTAASRVKQSKLGANVEPVLGICYGKTRTSYMKKRGYLKIVGQNFWYLISRNKQLYTDIIEPIGYRAEEHNAGFEKLKGGVINRLASEFTSRFCNDNDGTIDWVRVVGFNSGNFDLDSFITPS
jgi:hypothetical protein